MQEYDKPDMMGSVALKALGLYPSERYTLRGNRITLSAITSGGAFADNVASAIIPITNNPMPNRINQEPGIAVNGYPLIKDVAVIGRLAAGTIATPALVVGSLKYRDAAGIDHYLVPVSITLNATSVLSTAYQSIYIFGTSFPSAQPKDLGTLVFEGEVTLGTATNIQLDVTFNFGLVYGVPE